MMNPLSVVTLGCVCNHACPFACPRNGICGWS